MSLHCGTRVFLGVVLGLALTGLTIGQEEFSGPITCYECYDKAINTTCGEPVYQEDLKQMSTIKCKRGACVKWTFYRYGVYMMQRTCSEKVNMRIPLNNVCRTERNGNGYLCMCSDDTCNTAAHLHRHWVAYVIMAASLWLLQHYT